MCYLYLKLRVFLKRKFQPKSVLKGIVSFIYSIDNEVLFFFLNKFFMLLKKIILDNFKYNVQSNFVFLVIFLFTFQCYLLLKK